MVPDPERRAEGQDGPPAADLPEPPDLVREPALALHVLDELEEGLFTLDAEGRIAFWSEGARRLVGYTRGEMLGRPFRQLQCPDCPGFERLACGIERAEPGGALRAEACKVKCKSGRELFVRMTLHPLPAPGGGLRGAVGLPLPLRPPQAGPDPAHSAAPHAEQAHSRLGWMVGRSEPMQEAFSRIRQAAAGDVTVLISGESGTGKELAARAIHALSRRAHGPFQALNCSALPDSLLESERFGHVKGAFTGAIRDRVGVFQSAGAGTLFLDEIGELSPLLQVKLLRVLEEREIRRVGDECPIPVDVRRISATSGDLLRAIEEGTFREDFDYRVRVFEIEMPPLRERKIDIPLLARHFVDEFDRTHGKEVREITPAATEALLAYDWPGNVRELRNAVEHAFVTFRDGVLDVDDLPREVRGEGAGRGVLSPAERAERERVLAALRESGWNRTRAAERLGISRVTLWKRIRRYGLEPQDRQAG